MHHFCTTLVHIARVFNKTTHASNARFTIALDPTEFSVRGTLQYCPGSTTYNAALVNNKFQAATKRSPKFILFWKNSVYRCDLSMFFLCATLSTLVLLY